jgi:CheY-like chemotaxis protein
MDQEQLEYFPTASFLIQIWLSSSTQTGSKFCFTNPFTTVNETFILNQKSATIKNKLSILGKIKILIAEDDPTEHNHILIVIKKVASQIIHVSNEIEVLEQCKEHQNIDLLLIDCKTPKTYDDETIRKIRKHNKDIIIIALSNHTHDDNHKKILQIGFNDMITKPIKEQKLLNLIHSYFKQ